MSELNLKIDGITCPACVKLIERRISKIGGVNSVDVNLGGEATINSDQEIDLEEIKEVLSDTDYKVN
ncbi:MAG: heavy-metal-associated domain-containing protein [Patescibacteria group bacterium]|nr:heavy-metal-associated domain-containing protein [Patescibacteria group bacterium]